MLPQSQWKALCKTLETFCLRYLSLCFTQHKTWTWEHEQMLKLKQLPWCTLQTQEMEPLMSELARVSSNAKASAEDCGVGLLKTHSSHVGTCNIDFDITLCFFSISEGWSVFFFFCRLKNAILEVSLLSRSVNSKGANILFDDLYPEGLPLPYGQALQHTHTSIEAQVFLREIIKFRPVTYI